MKLKSIVYGLSLLACACLTVRCNSDDDGPAPQPGESGVTVKVMSYNMYDGSKLGLGAIANVIKEVDPDLVGLQEVTFNNHGYSDVTAKLAELTGMPYYFSIPATEDNKNGNAILSKTELTETEIYKFQDVAPTNYTRSIGFARTTIEGRDFYFATTHFDHMSDANRQAQAEQVLLKVGEFTAPVIVTGDFNDKPGTETINTLSAGMTLGCLYGYCPFTMTAPKPDGAIDFVFFTHGDFVSQDYNAYYKAYKESDHFPVYAVLMFK